jgi:branched-chain amino acid transport system permease protein
MTASLLVQSAIIGLSIGSIYILMALGLTLMFGMMHIINFAHGAVYMLGAFVIYYVYFQWGAPYFAAFLGPCLLGVSGTCRAGSIDRSGVDRTDAGALLALDVSPGRRLSCLRSADKHVPPVLRAPGTSPA